MESFDNEEFAITGTDRYNGFVYVVWWGDYTIGVQVPESVTTKEELFDVIRANRPNVKRSDAPVFDIAEALMEEHRLAKLPKYNNGEDVIEDLLRELEEGLETSDKETL